MAELSVAARGVMEHLWGLLGAALLGGVSALLYGRRLKQNVAIGMSDTIVPVQALLNPDKFQAAIYLAYTRGHLAYADRVGAAACRLFGLSPYGYERARFAFYHLTISLALFGMAYAFTRSTLAGWLAVLLVLASDLNEQGSLPAAGVYGPYHAYTAGALGALTLALLMNGLVIIPGILAGLVFGYHPIHGLIVGLTGAVTFLLGGLNSASHFPAYLVGGVIGTVPWMAYLITQRPWRFRKDSGHDPALWWHIVRVRGYSSIFTGIIWIGRQWYAWLGSAYTHALLFSLGAILPYSPSFVGGGEVGSTGVFAPWRVGVATILTSLVLSVLNYVLVDIGRQAWALGFSFTRSSVYAVYIAIGAAGASLAVLLQGQSAPGFVLGLLAGALVMVFPRRVTNNAAVAWFFVALVGAAVTGHPIFILAVVVCALGLSVDEIWRRAQGLPGGLEQDHWKLADVRETLYGASAPQPPSTGGGDGREAGTASLAEQVPRALRAGLRLQTLSRLHRITFAGAVLVLLLMLASGALPSRALGADGTGNPSLLAFAGIMLLAVMAWRKGTACREDGLIHGMYGEDLTDAWLNVQLWARANTPEGSLFLAEPYLPGFQGFAERPNLVDFIDIGGCYYVPSLATELERRLGSFGFHIRDFVLLNKTYMRRLMREAMTRLSADDLVRISHEHGVRYFVLHNGARSWEEVPEANRLYRNSYFCVIEAPISQTADPAAESDPLRERVDTSSSSTVSSQRRS